MTGKRYYLTTLGAWQRHAHRFANSHWVALGAAAAPVEPPEFHGATPIVVLIEADEGVHLSLEDEPAFEPLTHPLAQKPLSPTVQVALEPHGVAPGATTFDAAETIGRIHPLLRHRVF